MNTQKRIGLFGGSFNPPHMGHLAISLHCIKALNLHELWWIVTNRNPLKISQPQYTLADKQRLIECITQYDYRISLHCYDHISCFTVDIINHLIQNNYLKNKYVLILGIDNYLCLNKWKKWKEITHLLPFIVYNRLTEEYYNFYKLAQSYNHTVVNNTRLFYNPLPCVTFIANKISNLASQKISYKLNNQNKYTNFK